MSASQPSKSRPVIGLFESQLGRGFHRASLLSVRAAVLAAGADFVCFDGGVLAPTSSRESPANVLYDLAGPRNVDGLIIWASALDWELRPGQMEAFCRRFTSVPVVTVGRAFSGIPGILVDNYQGMRLAAEHLLREHGRRKIAFLRGPEGAEEEELRFRAYCDVLADNAIPFEPALVSSRTNWVRLDGPQKIAELLDERGLVAGIDFDALLSVGDDMACGAIEALRARGVRIPDDVAVTGFNDDEEGRAILPALTTVSQPVVEMGRAAVAALLDLFSGRPPAEVATLPLDLVIRRSCGCLSPAVTSAAARGTAPAAARTLNLPAAMAGVTGLPEAAMAALVDEFRAVLAGRDAERFLAGLNGTLQAAALGQYGSRDVRQWHEALSLMRRQMLPRLVEPARSVAEDLWQQARVLIGETAAQARSYQRFHADEDTHRLGDFSQHIQGAANRQALYDLIAAELPPFGVDACYLVLYHDAEQPTGAGQLVLAFDAAGRIDLASEPLFASRDLLPPRLAGRRPPDLVVLPLCFGEKQLGYMLLQADARALALGETLREQVSAALEGLFLREEVREAWRRAEEANLLKSKFLSTVSHELRTPLSLIAGTIEMVQREPLTGLPESFQHDLESIHMSARHLSHLISDVLDLARSQAGELRLVCEPVRLGQVLGSVAVLGEQMARERGLAWRVDFGERLPLVWGDRTRLQQVVLNLLGNAVKFTSKGCVSLWVETGRQEVMVAVSDTGMGIAAGEQELIFDEFRQSDRVSRRGFGGMGLGLAISKRLVELHGGRIGVLSTGTDGAGSTFYFTLPVLAQEAASPAQLPDRSDAVLLLAEDTGGSQQLHAFLAAKGFKVVALPAEPGGDWLAGVAASPPGAIVLDYGAAAENAWDLVHVLKLNPATSDIPVLFYSLCEGDCGAVLNLDYVAKPLGGELLAAALARQGMTRADGARHEILVVDDDPAVRHLHARMATAALPAAHVTTAADGRAALAAMEQAVPDLVLLDLMMPELDGFGVLEAMRGMPGLRDVPVIVLTAQVLGRQEMERLQKGVAAVLNKGVFTQDEVLGQIADALGRGASAWAVRRSGSRAWPWPTSTSTTPSRSRGRNWPAAWRSASATSPAASARRPGSRRSPTSTATASSRLQPSSSAVSSA